MVGIELKKLGWEIQKRLENKYEKVKQGNMESKYMFSLFDRNSVTCC